MSDAESRPRYPIWGPSRPIWSGFSVLTGCRPGEVCALRPAMSTGPTISGHTAPETHKTEHHDRERVIQIGPRAQLSSCDLTCYVHATAPFSSQNPNANGEQISILESVARPCPLRQPTGGES